MQITVRSEKLKKVPEVPGNKSWIIRYLLISALRGEPCEITNMNLCDDVLACLRCTSRFGTDLYCGESATVLRLLLPSMIQRYGKADFVCEGNLINRPLGIYQDIFSVAREGNRIHAEGTLRKNYAFSSTISSQFVSGLLIAGCEVHAPSVSSPYIEMTKKVLSESIPKQVTVPEDETLKAFFRIGSLPLGRAEDAPDLVPCWALQCAVTEGEWTINHVSRLRFKECDRVHAIWEILSALGADIQEQEDALMIRGKKSLPGGATVPSFGDHRMAMMAAAAAQFCENPVTIQGAECVKKSYPGFFEDYISCGGKIDVEN